MQKEKYVSRFCVLLFLIIKDANVNALSLTSCDNPLENEVCNLTCTTADHSRNVAFNKEPDASSVAQCVSGGACFGTDQYSISQPDAVTTVLSFIHSRNSTATWKCSYGPTPTSVLLPWATYPLRVLTTLSSNTTVDTNIDGNVTLECLYSEQAPTVTLQYEGTNGNTDAISAETFQCDATDIPCADVNFTTYGCPVVVKEETGIDLSDTYSIKLKIKVSHVQTEDVHTIVTDITFKHLISSVSKPSPVSTSIANYETISTVSDNITVLVEALTTISDVSLTTYKATRTLTESVNTVIYDSSFVANTEFYTIYNFSTTGVETHVPQSSFISSDLDTSMQASLLTTNSSVSMDLMSDNTAVTVSDTTAASIEGASTTTGILATAFDSAILGPSSPELTSSTIQNIQSVSSSINIYPTTPDGNGNNEKATSQIQSALSSPELISSSVQYLQSVSSSLGTYPTTPNGNNEQTASPIQSTFSENFIIISASVAGVIIIVVGSLMVLYWLNKLPGQHQHKTNELNRDKPDNISWSSFSPNNYMYNESYSGPVYHYRNIPLRLTSRYNVPYSYDHHMDYQNNWNNI